MSFAGVLRKSTAVDVLIGPFVDEDDGKTAENALTLSQGDIKLSKNGQTLAQKNDSTAAAFDANGYYNCELDTTDTNTLGQLTLIVHESGALPIRLDFQVISQANYDNLYGTADIVDKMWDELIQGNDHNTKFSAGRRLKDASSGQGGGTNPPIEPVTVHSGTAQAGTTNTITFDTAAIGTDNIYRGSLVNITGGTGVGQTNVIYSYNGTTKVATMAKDWITIPNATSTFDVLASSTAINSDEGVAQAGGATSITLATTASAYDDIYKGALITIVSGTGSGQSREITAYNGTTKMATVAAWGTQPDSTSVYAVLPDKQVSGDSITNNTVVQDISNISNTTYTTIYEGSDVATSIAKTWAAAATLAATSAYGGVVDPVAADQQYDYTSDVDLETSGYNGAQLLIEFKGSGTQDRLTVDVFGSLDGTTYDNEPYSHTEIKSNGGYQKFSLVVKDLAHFRLGLKGSNTNDTFDYQVTYQPWT